MEIQSKITKILAEDDTARLRTYASKMLIDSKMDWIEFIAFLRQASRKVHSKYWLKRSHTVLMIFDAVDLLGIDDNIFDILQSIEGSDDWRTTSELAREALMKTARSQLQSGGSTLFFNIDRMSKTESVTLIPDLVQARHRETLFIISDYEDVLSNLDREWVDVTRLWRTTNGFRALRSRNYGTAIHVREYQEIRNMILEEIGVHLDDVNSERKKLEEEQTRYLNLSNELNNFISALVSSYGIRGNYDPVYKSSFDYMGVDDF